MPADLDAIRKRLEAATPGPWFASEYLDDGRVGVVSHDGEIVVGVSAWLFRGNADLISHTPTDIAALLVEVEALRSERDIWRQTAVDEAAHVEKLHEIAVRRSDELARLRSPVPHLCPALTRVARIVRRHVPVGHPDRAEALRDLREVRDGVHALRAQTTERKP